MTKFIDSVNLSDWQIETPTGFSDIKALYKTEQYRIYKLVLENGMVITTADRHKFISAGGYEVFADELSVGDILQTKKGLSAVKEVYPTGEYDHCYDIEINDANHVYYTNGILSHNTTCAAAYILHQLITVPNLNVAILANKLESAKEVLERVKFSYSMLPWYMKHGVIKWNEKSIKINHGDHGSTVFVGACSADSIRGKSCLAGNTIIQVKDFNGLPDRVMIKDIDPSLHKEVMTYKGYRRFKTVVNNGVRNTVKLTFSDGVQLVCTPDHLIYCNTIHGYLEAGKLNFGYEYSGRRLLSIEKGKRQAVYDIINVEDTNSFIANGLSVHNCSILYIDEFAMIENAIEFYESTFPVVSSSSSSQVIITSTPKGLNFFYKLWKGAKEKANQYIPYFAPWWAHPKRDEAWEKTTREQMQTEQAFAQEYECVTGDTRVTVKSLYTNKVREMTIEELYLSDNNYLILSETGFKAFNGVKMTANRECLLVKTSSCTLKGTLDHRIMTENGWSALSELMIGDLVKTKNGLEPVVSVDNIGKHDVYDALEVADGHTYYTNGIVSHNCEFIGSALTLISGKKLKELSSTEPVERINDNTRIYKKVQPNHKYIATVDVGEGTTQDFSVVQIIDVTNDTYEQVAVYTDNKIQPDALPEIIYSMATTYNNAYVVVESNSIGKIVGDGLFYDLEYENMLTSTTKYGETSIREGMSKLNVGLRQTKRTKAIGCAALKALIESDVLVLHDERTIDELFNFVKDKESYKAADNGKDDIVMTLVMFAYITKSEFFSELTGKNPRNSITDSMLDRDKVPYQMFADLNRDTDYSGENMFVTLNVGGTNIPVVQTNDNSIFQ